MKTDVYSFAVVLWEMLTGETPYSNIKNREHLRQVVDEQDGRLEIEVEWPKRVQNILKSSFDVKHENWLVSMIDPDPISARDALAAPNTHNYLVIILHHPLNDGTELRRKPTHSDGTAGR